MDLDQVEAFLTLAEELHFGRTATRMHVSQPRVSRLIAAVERQIGGALFERSSREVKLTALGVQLRSELAPAYAALLAAVDNAKVAAREVRGVLRIGFTQSTAFESVSHLIARFAAAHPECRVVQSEVSYGDMFEPLRRGEIDVLVNWLYLDEPDLVAGPVIERQQRVLAVARTDPLAARRSVRLEDLADRQVARVDGLPAGFYDGMLPPATPAGRPIPRSVPAKSMSEIFALVAAGLIVHPTIDSMRRLWPRTDIVWLPIDDLPPAELGLVWRRGDENGRIRELARYAAGFSATDQRPGVRPP